MSAGLGVGLAAGAVLCAIAFAVGQSLLSGEVRAWVPHLARRLVRSAARQLPPDARERYERDWLAELAAWEDRPLSALVKAAHIRWAANGIRGSLCGVSVSGDRLKRVFDLSIALVALFILLPVLLGIAISIKLDSRGPVFVRVPRAGRDDASFPLFQFRSMHVDMTSRLEGNDSDDGIMFKIRRDPRLTRLGHTLRRFGLDQLPQLFNVLRGDMSIVGPRPLPPRDAPSEEEAERLRSSVRPGLTGPSQAEDLFPYPALSDEEKARLDAEYARSRSFRMDLRLIVRPVFDLLRRRLTRRGP